MENKFTKKLKKGNERRKLGNGAEKRARKAELFGDRSPQNEKLQ
jgi:hypothetical protein